MASFQVSTPEKFNFKPEDWERWIRRFERFRIASKLDKENAAAQVNTLIYSMGDEADDILTSLKLTDEERASYTTVKGKLDNFFIVKRNVIYERAKFNMRVQRVGESVDNFITDLFSLAEHCGFGDLHDELIRDRIVVGLSDKGLSEKLQLEADLTLEKAMTQARQKELVHHQQGILQQNFTSTGSSVDQIKAKKNPGNTNFRPSQKGNKFKSNLKCFRCNGSVHNKSECPARDSFCHACQKKGHWKRACKSPSKVDEVSSELDNETFLGEVIDAVNSFQQPWQAEVFVNNSPVKFKIDTGADVSVIPAKLFSDLANNVTLKPTNKILLGPCNYKLNCIGKFDAKLMSCNASIDDEIFVIDGLDRPLLGRKACKSLNLIQNLAEINKVTNASNIMQQYPTLFSGLGKLEGEYHISLKEDAKPFALTVPRKVPLPLLSETKKEIDRMLELGVIRPVQEPTEWCAPIVIVPKPNGKVRLCVDLTKLNLSVKREIHPLPSVDHILGKLGNSKVFSKLDANSAFWQRTLSESSQLLTTFITPWGRYCFLRLPYGITTGSEQFQRCMAEKLIGLEGVECNIDDILIHGRSQDEHDQRLHAVLNKLKEAHITLNPEKCEFSKTSIKILGHIVSSEGIKPDPEKIKSILSLPVPKNVAEIRSFLGMVNQQSKFAPDLATKTKPLRDLLNKRSTWTWGAPQQKAYEDIKTCLTEAPILALYDCNRETKISADASSYGIGGVVYQLQDDSNWKPIAYFSRALTPTETRYSQIEKECLAFTWLAERASDYILGKEITGETDHKPLVPLLTTHSIDQLPPRIQRMRMRLMRFHIKSLVHIPGKEMYTSDMLSRMIPKDGNIMQNELESEINNYVCSIIDTIPISDIKLQQLIEAQNEDEVTKKVKEFCVEGWPERHQLASAVRPYWADRGELTIVKGILLKSTRLVIPSAMRLEILDRVHEGHQGITKCRERAKQSIWWPGMSKQIQDMIECCRVCNEHKKNSAEPLIPTPFPDRPWQIIGLDFFKFKTVDFLIVVDYYSRYIELGAMNKNKTASEVLRVLKSLFARHGIPETLRSDNGPPFDSAEYLAFAREWGCKVVTSSPAFPRSNGEVERAVQTAKNILKKSSEPEKALLAYRSTPLQSGYSPSQLLMGRVIRSTLPTLDSKLNPKLPELDTLRRREDESRRQQKLCYDKRHRAIPLTALKPDTEVNITTHHEQGTIIKPADSPRSYYVQTPTRVIRRNREHIVPLHPSTHAESPDSRVQTTPVESTSRTTELNILSRPKRNIKPTLKALENMSLN